jgi:hypothetical protein
MSSSYRLFDGNTVDLSEISDIGPIVWRDAESPAGAVGSFSVSLRDGEQRLMNFGITKLVGAFRFMRCVQENGQRHDGACVIRSAYRSLEGDARRLLSMHHGDFVQSWGAFDTRQREAA